MQTKEPTALKSLLEYFKHENGEDPSNGEWQSMNADYGSPRFSAVLIRQKSRTNKNNKLNYCMNCVYARIYAVLQMYDANRNKWPLLIRWSFSLFIWLLAVMRIFLLFFVYFFVAGNIPVSSWFLILFHKRNQITVTNFVLYILPNFLRKRKKTHVKWGGGENSNTLPIYWMDGNNPPFPSFELSLVKCRDTSIIFERMFGVFLILGFPFSVHVFID